MQLRRLQSVLTLAVACILSAGVTWTVMRLAHLPRRSYVPVVMQVRLFGEGPPADADLLEQVARALESRWGYDVRVLTGGRVEVQIPVYNGRPVMSVDEFRDANLRLSYAQLAFLDTELSEVFKGDGSNSGQVVGPGRELVPLAKGAMILQPWPAIVDGGTQLMITGRSERIGETAPLFRNVVASRKADGGYEVRCKLYASGPDVGGTVGRFLDGHKGEPLALCLGGKAVVAPLTARMSEDSLVLEGRMSGEQAGYVCRLLNMFSLHYRLLPAPAK